MSDEFSVKREDGMLQRLGEHPAIEIVDVGEEMVHCRSLDVETALVADMSSRVAGYSNRAHVWEEIERDEHEYMMYGTLCHHMKAPFHILPSPVSDDDAWRVNADDPERANVPCDTCKGLLSERQDT